MNDTLYYKASRYFRERYRKCVQRICIDGGFTCPNRDGKCGTGGCIFCGEHGAGDYIDGCTIARTSSCDRTVSVRGQLDKRIGGYKGRKRFVAYFQSFTGTYAPPERLKALYDEALCSDLILALAVATRPDCIDEEIASLLESYKTRCDVWVELGLQTSDDDTARFINRGYESREFVRACGILKAHGIPVVAHIMIGLPGENMTHLAETVRFVNSCGVWGIKLHSVYVMKSTVLERLYREGKYTPPTMEEYAEGAVYVLTHISPDVVVHRLTGDCPPELLVAPEWNADKSRTMELILGTMRENGLRQGIYYR